MKTIGDLLKEGRIAKGLSRQELSEMTHIKVSFIQAIENGEWGLLPEFNIVTGFVKSISHFINIDERQAVSLLRRDYPPLLKPKIQQKGTKEIEKKLSWGPRLTFFVGIVLILIVVLGYLGFQYKKFNSPPFLAVNEPSEGQTVTGKTVKVSGRTDSDATLDINNQPVLIDNNGNFNTQLDVSGDKNQILVTAKSRTGKETAISRTIKVLQ